MDCTVHTCTAVTYNLHVWTHIIIILVCFYSPVQVRVYEITEPLKQTRLSLQETVKELRWQLTARETEIQSTHQVYAYIHYTHVHTHTHMYYRT